MTTPPPNTTAITRAFTVTVVADDAGIRLDRWFQRHYPHIGFGAIHKLVRTGQVRIDGKRATADTRLEEGCALRLPPALSHPAPNAAPSSKNLSASHHAKAAHMLQAVLFEDEDIVVINKPSGLATQGGTGVKISVDDLSHVLVAEGAPRPRLVHRLDRDTSGVLVLAKSAAAAAFFARQFQSHTLRKIYWAIVNGQPARAKGVVRLPLKRVEGAFDKIQVDSHGDPAITHYRVRGKSADNALTWLELEPETGRMHQLRVHCVSLGTPIVGDRKYSVLSPKEAPKTTSMALHAHSLELPLRSGGVHKIIAPLPAALRALWQAHGWSEEDTEA